MSKKMIKPLIIWAFVLAGLAAVVVQAKGNKVLIQHNGKNICVSENAVKAHETHIGDVIPSDAVPCDEDDDDGGGTPSPTAGAL